MASAGPDANPSGKAGRRLSTSADEREEQLLSLQRQETEDLAKGASEAKDLRDKTGYASLRAIFDKFDTDKSGYLSPKELLLVFNSLEVYVSADELQGVIEFVDADKNGVLSFDEFVALRDMLVADKVSPQHLSTSNASLTDTTKRFYTTQIQRMRAIFHDPKRAVCDAESVKHLMRQQDKAAHHFSRPTEDHLITWNAHPLRRRLAAILTSHRFEMAVVGLLIIDIVLVLVELLLLEYSTVQRDDCDTAVVLAAGGVDAVATAEATALNIHSIGVGAGEEAAHEVAHSAHNEHTTIEQVEHGLHIVGLTIICIFVFELTLQLIAFGGHFFIHYPNDKSEHVSPLKEGIGLLHAHVSSRDVAGVPGAAAAAAAAAGQVTVVVDGEKEKEEEDEKEEEAEAEADGADVDERRRAEAGERKQRLAEKVKREKEEEEKEGWHIRTMNCFDLLIVVTSFFFELFIPAIGSLVSMLRMWRIIRVGHGVYMAAHEKMIMQFHEREEVLRDDIVELVKHGEAVRARAEADAQFKIDHLQSMLKYHVQQSAQLRGKLYAYDAEAAAAESDMPSLGATRGD